MESQSSFSEERESRGRGEDLESKPWAEGPTLGRGRQGWQMEELKPALGFMGLREPGARRFLVPRLVPRQSPWDLITNVCCAHRVDRGGGRAVCLPPRTH